MNCRLHQQYCNCLSICSKRVLLWFAIFFGCHLEGCHFLVLRYPISVYRLTEFCRWKIKKEKCGKEIKFDVNQHNTYDECILKHKHTHTHAQLNGAYHICSFFLLGKQTNKQFFFLDQILFSMFSKQIGENSLKISNAYGVHG